MANKLIIKRSSVASKVPLATDLEPGELAVNLADQKLYSKKSDGTVILVGSGLGGTGDVQGTASSTDNALARFDGTTGKIIQNSSATLDDSGNLKVLSLTTDRHVNSTGRVLTYDFSAAPSSAVGDLDDYFDVGEALELFAFVATGDSQNYYVEGTVKIQSGASVETLFVRAAIRSDVRPQYSWSGQYERYSEADYLTCTPVFWVNETTGTGEIRLVLKFVTGNIQDIECSFKVFQRDNYGSALTVTTNHVSSAVPTNFVEYSLNKRIDLTPAGLASNVFVGALSGNAATATKLATARTIGGVSFDGTANINLPGVNAVGNQNTTGSSASCTGNAETATKLATARTINGVSFDGSANITIADGTKLPLAGGTMTGLLATRTSTVNTSTAGSTNTLEIMGSTGGGAVFSLHRAGAYAVNIGLDTDNVFRIGGWSASANRLQMDMSGNLTMAGNVTAYSDERLKTNWRDLGEGFVARLAGVKVGVYDRIDTGETQVGVSAQSLREVMPEAVLGDETLAVAYGNAALAACVELAKEVVALRAEIEALRRRSKEGSWLYHHLVPSPFRK